MATVQEQYTEIVKQSQDAVLSAVDTWTRTVQDAFGQVPTPTTQVDPSDVIDQVFEFATKLLAMQRDFAHNLVKTSSAATDALRQGAAQTAETISHQG